MAASLKSLTDMNNPSDLCWAWFELFDLNGSKLYESQRAVRPLNEFNKFPSSGSFPLPNRHGVTIEYGGMEFNKPCDALMITRTVDKDALEAKKREIFGMLEEYGASINYTRVNRRGDLSSIGQIELDNEKFASYTRCQCSIIFYLQKLIRR